jgi:regulatory protein
VSHEAGAPIGAGEARELAYRYVGRREYSCHELALKLRRRGVDPATAESVVGDLSCKGLVSDARFAEVFTRTRVAGLCGPSKIRALLRQKGIDEELIMATLAEYTDTWADSALAWVRKKATFPMDIKQKGRIYRSGMNRGFSHEHMMRALDRHQAES